MQPPYPRAKSPLALPDARSPQGLPGTISLGFPVPQMDVSIANASLMRMGRMPGDRFDAWPRIRAGGEGMPAITGNCRPVATQRGWRMATSIDCGSSWRAPPPRQRTDDVVIACGKQVPGNGEMSIGANLNSRH